MLSESSYLSKGFFLKIFAAISLFWATNESFAQLVISNAPRKMSFAHTYGGGANMRTQEEDTLTLKLPFWEDFSTSKTEPDTLKWLKKSGVFVNNTLAYSPPTKNVATFDGLDTLGKAYNSQPATLRGTRDVLTSHFFDLSALKPDSMLYLSFFWQMQGRGEIPDSEDYIRLECKDSLGNWQRLWQKNGKGEVKKDTFQQEMIFLQNPAFFHPKFQLRFVNYGRLSGAFDAWHLDYIYLNSQRTPEDIFRKDMACSEYPEFITKVYSSMPYKHFLSDTTFFRRDTVRTNFNNLFNVFNTLAYKTELFDSESGAFYGVIMDTAGIIKANQWNYSLPAAPFYKNFPTDREKLRVTCRYSVNTNELDNFLPPLNFRNNDTISRETIFDDYYAYDDGSAEYGLGLAQRFGKLAYKFHTYKEARMTHIDVYFLPVGKKLSGETFNLMVWKRLDFSTSNPKDEVLLLQNIPFTPSESTDKLTRIKLMQPISVADSFYIGWQQLGNEMLPCGYDKNTESGELIFYNTSNRWEQNTIHKGSLMLRPVFGGADPLANKDEDKILTFNLFPNPAKEKVYIEGKFDKVLLTDILGRKILETESTGEEILTLETREIPAGIYILTVLEGEKKASKKLVIEK